MNQEENNIVDLANDEEQKKELSQLLGVDDPMDFVDNLQMFAMIKSQFIRTYLAVEAKFGPSMTISSFSSLWADLLVSTIHTPINTQDLKENLLKGIVNQLKMGGIDASITISNTMEEEYRNRMIRNAKKNFSRIPDNDDGTMKNEIKKTVKYLRSLKTYKRTEFNVMGEDNSANTSSDGVQVSSSKSEGTETSD